MAKNEDKAPARPDVVWTLIDDGLEPKPAPWGFVIRNPLSRTLLPKQKIDVKLGVAASAPVLAWPRGDMAGYVTVQQFVPAGTELVVTIENRSAHAPLLVEDLEPLLNIHPLIFKGTAGVG